jgi:hypothetical protein
MQAWRTRLERLGRVVCFDYPYVREGSRRPDRLPVLVDAHRAALREARQTHGGPVVLVGKSMGGRVGCHASLEESLKESLEAPVHALVCLGYPLRGQGKNPKLRDAVLRALTTRILFVQGTRDPLCPLELLAPVRTAMQCENDLFVVEAADHSLQVTKTQLRADGETQDDVDERILAAIARFLSRPAP